jgi:hypothetical protein
MTEELSNPNTSTISIVFRTTKFNASQKLTNAPLNENNYKP